jgi:hypothetical protein
MILNKAYKQNLKDNKVENQKYLTFKLYIKIEAQWKLLIE